MDGPGLAGPVSFTGDETSGPLGALTESSGWFPAVFPREPSPMLQARPSGELGAPYTVTYLVPGPDNDSFTILLQVYPYAEGGPVTFVEPGQAIFDTTASGGWYRAGPGLKASLVAAGLPGRRARPVGRRLLVPDRRGLGGSAPRRAAAGLGVALLARRRTRPAPA